MRLAHAACIVSVALMVGICAGGMVEDHGIAGRRLLEELEVVDVSSTGSRSEVADLASSSQPAPSSDENSKASAAVIAQQQAVQVALAAQTAKATASDSSKLYLKPPGCRPLDLDDLREYTKKRTQCALTEPAPSALTTPPTQTPMVMNITDAKVVAINEPKKQFTMEFTRMFTWHDAMGEKVDSNSLWNPRMMFSFPNGVKVEDLAPPRLLYEAVGSMTMIEYLRVTFENEWDYTAYPFDHINLVGKMWSTSGTNILEPVTLKMDAEGQRDMFGFHPTSKLSGSQYLVGQPLGPKGKWGYSQMIELQLNATRNKEHFGIHLFFPVTVVWLIVFGTLFMAIAQLMPRLAASVLGLLILYTYMPSMMASVPAHQKPVWAEYWLAIQAVIISIVCCHHVAAHYVNERWGETKSVHMDVAMRFCHPLLYVLSYGYALAAIISPWTLGTYLINFGSFLLLLLTYGVAFAVCEKRSANRNEKTHYAGI